VANSPFGPQPRAAVALAPTAFAPLPGESAQPAVPPVFAQVRADVETGAPGALAKLIALAEADHPQAQRYLGQLYDEGKAGLPHDPVQARRFTTLAAENGDPDGMHNLGIAYFRGVGGPKDTASAAQWFRKAAAAGVTESQYNLGVLYQSGDGVPRDLAQARYWFGLAAASGDGEARQALAQLTTQSSAAAPATRR
jgi:localization factor PodJL